MCWCIVHSKISSYGMAGEIDWVAAFLSDRMQKMCVNGKAFPCAQVTSGIPQRSTIGLVLFILYINDLSDVVLNDVYLFADDTKIYSEISNINDCVSLQEDLDNCVKLSDTWLLAFFPDKCKVVRLGNRSDEAYE